MTNRCPPAGDVLQNSSDSGEEPSLLLLSVAQTQSPPEPDRRDEEVPLRERQRGVLQGGRRRRYELEHRLVRLVHARPQPAGGDVRLSLLLNLMKSSLIFDAPDERSRSPRRHKPPFSLAVGHRTLSGRLLAQTQPDRRLLPALLSPDLRHTAAAPHHHRSEVTHTHTVRSGTRVIRRSISDTQTGNTRERTRLSQSGDRSGDQLVLVPAVCHWLHLMSA